MNGVQLNLELIDSDFNQAGNFDELIDRFNINLTLPANTSKTFINISGIFNFTTVNFRIEARCSMDFTGNFCSETTSNREEVGFSISVRVAVGVAVGVMILLLLILGGVVLFGVIARRNRKKKAEIARRAHLQESGGSTDYSTLVRLLAIIIIHACIYSTSEPVLTDHAWAKKKLSLNRGGLAKCMVKPQVVFGLGHAQVIFGPLIGT